MSRWPRSEHPLPLGPARPGRRGGAGRSGAARGAACRPAVTTGDVLGVGIGVPGTVEQGAEAVVHAQTSAGTRCRWSGCCAARHGAAALLRQRRQDAGPGRDVVRRRPGRPARGDRAGRLRRRRRGRHQRQHLPGRHQQRRRVGAHHASCTAAGPAGAARAAAWRRTSGAEGVLDRYRQARGGRPVPGADEQAALAELLAAAARSGPRPGAGRDRRLPGRRHRQPDQPVQPGADRAGRLGRAGAGRHGCCRRSRRRRRSTRCATRSSRRPSSWAARAGRGRVRRGHAAGGGPARPRRGARSDRRARLDAPA